MNKESSESEELKKDDTKPRSGIINFEKRKHPRFTVDLPLEYRRISSPVIQPGRVINASEGGLLIYFPEKLEIGQHLELRLFFASDSELNTIEMLVQVVWTDLHLGKDWGDHRTGVKFVDIAPVDLDKLKNFLRRLSG